MYVRQPNANGAGASRVKIPDNYGGNAFSSSYYSDMPPPARQSSQPKTDGEYVMPHTVDLPPKSSPLADKLRNPLPPSHEISQTDEILNITSPSEIDIPHVDHKEKSSDTDLHQEPHKQQSNSSLLSALIPKGSISGNFPFGHGIGGEELLILGMMLLVYLSGSERGEIDGEFIILLGLLLFAG